MANKAKEKGHSYKCLIEIEGLATTHPSPGPNFLSMALGTLIRIMSMDYVKFIILIK